MKIKAFLCHFSHEKCLGVNTKTKEFYETSVSIEIWIAIIDELTHETQDSNGRVETTE